MPPAVRIAKIEGLSDAHVASLEAKGIKTIDDLWSQVGADFNAGIKQVSEKTTVPEAVITAVLIADGLGKVKIKYGRLAQFQNARTWVILVLVAAVAYGSYMLAFRVELPRQLVVINPRGIAPYQVIGQGDIALRRTPFRTAQTVNDPATVIGGYALTKLEPNAPIRNNQILTAAVSREMQGNYIVSVPVKESSLVLAPKPGAKLSLLPLAEQSKDKPQPPPAPIDATLLGIEARGGVTTLVVAVENNPEKINALMAGATIVNVVH
jgi:hypothetical protein